MPRAGVMYQCHHRQISRCVCVWYAVECYKFIKKNAILVIRGTSAEREALRENYDGETHE